MSSWRSARMESEDPGLQLCCLIPSQEWDINTHARANRQHSNVGAYKLGLYHRHFCWIFIIFHLSEGICWQGNINEYSYEWWRWQDLYYWTGFLQNQFQEPVKDLALCGLSSSTDSDFFLRRFKLEEGWNHLIFIPWGQSSSTESDFLKDV